jgi:hypothetical protein
VNAEFRVAFDKQVDVIRHHLNLDQGHVTLRANFCGDCFEPYIDIVDQNLSPILRAPDNVKLAVKGDIAIRPHTAVYISMPHNSESFGFAERLFLPMAKARGIPAILLKIPEPCLGGAFHDQVCFAVRMTLATTPYDLFGSML